MPAARDLADRWPRRPVLWLASALLVAAFVFAFRVADPPLSVDEILTKWMASAPTAAGVVQRTRTHSIGPVYFLLVHATMHVVPDATLAMRSLSIICGLAGVALVFALGSRLVDRSFGAVACAIAALDSLVIYYAQEGRPYALALAAVLAAAWGVVRWRDGGSGWWLALYGACMALVLSTTYVFGLIVLPLGLFLLVAGGGTRSRLRALGAFSLASLISLVGLLASLESLRFAMQNAGAIGSFLEPHPMGRIPLILTKYTLLTFIAGAIALICCPGTLSQGVRPDAPRARRIREAVLLGMLWYAVPVGTLQVLAWTTGVRLFAIRYLFVYLGGPLLLAAVPCVLAGRRTRFPQVYATVVIGILAANLAGVFLSEGMFARKARKHVDFGPVLAAAAHGTAADDLILVQSLYIEGDMLRTPGAVRGLGAYLLAPVEALLPTPPPATTLPLPRGRAIKPFEAYYESVVSPAISRSRRVIVVSHGPGKRFQEWFSRTHGSAFSGPTVERDKWPTRRWGVHLLRYVRKPTPHAGVGPRQDCPARPDALPVGTRQRTPDRRGGRTTRARSRGPATMRSDSSNLLSHMGFGLGLATRLSSGTTIATRQSRRWRMQPTDVGARA